MLAVGAAAAVAMGLMTAVEAQEECGVERHQISRVAKELLDTLPAPEPGAEPGHVELQALDLVSVGTRRITQKPSVFLSAELRAAVWQFWKERCWSNPDMSRVTWGRPPGATDKIEHCAHMLGCSVEELFQEYKQANPVGDNDPS